MSSKSQYAVQNQKSAEIVLKLAQIPGESLKKFFPGIFLEINFIPVEYSLSLEFILKVW